VPTRWNSEEIDYTGSISKCGDRRVRTLLYEAANVMLTRYGDDLALKDWALHIDRRSTMRKARVALARQLAIIMHAMLRDVTEFHAAWGVVEQTGGRNEHPSGAMPKEGMGDGADSVASGRSDRPTAVCNQATPHPADPIECNRACRERRSQRHTSTAQDPSSRPLRLLGLLVTDKRTSGDMLL
jgi:hypothetical protein